MWRQKADGPYVQNRSRQLCNWRAKARRPALDGNDTLAWPPCSAAQAGCDWKALSDY